MKLKDIQKDYDAIFSLGNGCSVAQRLQQYQLRPYSGVIDWMLSLNLLQVVNLLQNKFRDFMEKENLIWDGYDASKDSLLLRDSIYDITSVHDFFLTKNTPTDWNTYEEFRIKLNRRIQRFLNKLDVCKRILFVRIGGTYEEVKQLELTLSKMVKGEFRVLLINPIAESKVVEYNWDLSNTCSIGISLVDERLWEQILQGITHNDVQ